MIEAVFRSFLLQSAALTGLVGDRVYQDRAPQNATYPLCVIRKMGSEGTHGHYYLPQHAETRYRVMAFAQDYPTLIALREGLKGLDGFAVAVSTAAGADLTWNTAGSELQSAMIAFETDLFEQESQLFQLITDWELFHNQAMTPGIV